MDRPKAEQILTSFLQANSGAYPPKDPLEASLWLEAAYSNGLIPKRELYDGKYYYGTCRNARVARWDGARERFTYIRSKFGHLFPEDINPCEEDNGFDLFVPVAEVEPMEEELIQPTWKGYGC